MADSLERRQLLIAAIGNAIGFSAAIAVPLWLPQVSGRFGTAAWVGGAIASAQLMVAAICNIAMSACLERLPLRPTAVACAVVAAMGYALACAPVLPAFITGLLIAGGALGGLLAIVVGLVARSTDPQRGFSMLTAAHALFAAGFYLTMPLLMTPLGFGALTAGLALLSLGVVPMLRGLVMPPAPAPIAMAASDAQTSGAFWAGSLGLLGTLALTAGHNVIQSHAILMGAAVDLGPAIPSGIFTIGSLASLMGPVAAIALGARFGIRLPLTAGMGLLVLTAAILATTGNGMIFSTTMIVFLAVVMFAIPYVLAVLAAAGDAGRWAGAAPAFLMIGGALGPLIAAWALASGGVGWIGGTGAVMLGLSTIALLASATRSHRQA